MGAGVVGHRDVHRRQPVHIAGCDKGFFVRGPDAVDDRRMARVSRGFVIEFTAEVDNLHDGSPGLTQLEIKQTPSLRAKRSNPALVNRARKLDCFVACAPRNDEYPFTPSSPSAAE